MASILIVFKLGKPILVERSKDNDYLINISNRFIKIGAELEYSYKLYESKASFRFPSKDSLIRESISMNLSVAEYCYWFIRTRLKQLN